MWILILIPALFFLLIIVSIFYDKIVPRSGQAWLNALHGLSKLNLNNPFKSKRGAKKTLAIGYFSSLMFESIGLMWLSEFNSKGFIDIGKSDPVIIRGSDALITTYGFLFGGLAVLFYTLYLTICYLTHNHLGNIPSEPEQDPLATVCTGCGNVSSIIDSTSSICKKCGCKVEELKGYLDRHERFEFENKNKEKG